MRSGRVGYEFIRAPFRWRIDDGAWGHDGPDRLTTDLMSLQDWNEVASGCSLAVPT